MTIRFGAPGLAVSATLILAACSPEGVAVVEQPAPAVAMDRVPADPSHYAARSDGNRMISSIDVADFHPELLKNEVAYETAEAPGTVVIDTKGPFLYLVQGEGRALRYGIAIGREGFGWTGTGTIARNAKWPTWTPPPEMIERDPKLEKWKDGMPGGETNPLGARALYIYFGDRDSGYRIHGTNQPRSIGYAASSGCFRMINQDVIDLYDRVERGAKVVVI